MLLMRRAAFSPTGVGIQYFLKQNKSLMVSPICSKVISEKSEAVNFHEKNWTVQLRRPLHVTSVNRDLEAGLRALGAGVAATALAGSGIGLGLIFGNLLSAIARNPSVGNKVFTNAIMGAAFCESLGLFAMTIGQEMTFKKTLETGWKIQEVKENISSRF